MSPEPAATPVAEMVETALGPVEVARAGEGPPVLVVHGMPGGSDLHAALLDALGAGTVGVLAWSGGGPSGYRLAVRQPTASPGWSRRWP